MKFLVLAGLLTGFLALAETPTGTSQQAVVQPAAPSPVSASVTLRPSWTLEKDEFHTENDVTLSYNFSPSFGMDYVQYWQTNIFDPSGKASGLGLRTNDGFLRTRFMKVWQSVAQDLTFDMETRFYTPTDYQMRDAGFITTVRHYFSLTKKFSPSFSLSLQEIPIFHWYDVAGTGTTANPIFENRTYLIASYSFTPKITLIFPLMINISKYRPFAGAANNDSWGYYLWLWPEIDFQVGSKTTLGVAFRSDNLLNKDNSGLALFGADGGLTKGFPQLILSQAL